jgi:5-methylcytosine-specific restriction endonuclease McrA
MIKILVVIPESGAPASASEEVDHIVPKKQGGTDDESNLQSLCKPHHSAKTAREVLNG